MKKLYKKPQLKVHFTKLRSHLMEGSEQATGTGESGGGGHGYSDPAKGSGLFDNDDWGNVWSSNDDF